jgi:carbon-monoxide dehydrogenase medium subunit
MVGVFVADGAAGTRVAVTGAGEDGVFRHTAMETALGAGWDSGALDGVQVGSDGLLSDLHCAADYRASLIKTIAKRAVAAA